MARDPNDDSGGFVDQMLAIQEHKRKYGSNQPDHTGPTTGGNDLLVAFILLGMFWGLLSTAGDILSGVIGAGIGAALAFAIGFTFSIPRRVFEAIHRKRNPPPPRMKTVNDQIDWKAYEREKKRREKEEASRK